jgi:hypothetical protein
LLDELQPLLQRKPANRRQDFVERAHDIKHSAEPRMAGSPANASGSARNRVPRPTSDDY